MLDPLEMVVIAVIAIVFLMFGPKKIPELARSIGLARKEFNDASAIASGKELTLAPPTLGSNPSLLPPTGTGDPLIDSAKRLGISTEGRSPQEISNAIVDRSRS